MGWIRELRTNPDFCNAIKVGRALNALLFAMDVSRGPFDRLPSGTRNGHRAVLVLAGYVYETLILLKSLDEYTTESFFTKADVLLKDRRRWKVAEKLRNRSGFHLDHDDEVTTKTLETLKEGNYDLYSAQDLMAGMTLGEYYFNLADDIDVQYFNSEFKDSSHRTQNQTSEHVIKSLGQLAKEVAFAALELHQGLLAKVGLVAETEASQ